MTQPEEEDPRLDRVVDLIVQLSSGNLTARLDPSPAGDKLDTIITGANRLARELGDMYSDLEQRVDEQAELLRQAQGELERLALRDPLTGLANRSMLGDQIGLAMNQVGLGGGVTPPAVLVLDLDSFKTINDGLGHTAGDAVLVEVARRLTSVVGPHDTVARLSGDEFAVVLPATTVAAAEQMAETILEALTEPLTVHGRTVWTLASIGVRVAVPGEPAELLLRDADTAMYEAKTSGRGRAVLYQPAMHHAVQRRLRVVSELSSAIHNHQLRLLYQPIIDLETNRISGVEALVRWHHPHRGLIMPAEFIAVAEDSGLIVDLGHWVANEAIAQLARWLPVVESDPGFRVHLNVSPVELRRPGLSGFLGNALDRNDVPASRLALEISETALMSEDVAGLEALRGLQGLGASLEIDDFGTGYSSISYLRRLPIDTVKVDRSLISDIPNDGDQRRFVGAVLHLISSAGLTAVVEGVETPEQADLLRALGCRHAQGYFFGQPMSADLVTVRLLADREAAASGASPARRLPRPHIGD